MYEIHNKVRKLVNKVKTAVNPRIHMDDFLNLPPFDMVFAWNAPKELFLTGRDAYANRRLTADKRKKAKGKYNRYDLVVTINGIKSRIYNLMHNPPKGFCVDHISQITNDARPENTRISSPEQNAQNRDNVDQGDVLKHESGLYFVRFPRDPDASKQMFEYREDAETYLFELQDKHFGEYGRRRSKKIADKYDTHLFDDLFAPLFSPSDSELISEIEEMPYVYEVKKKNGYFFNWAKIHLRILNAEYRHLFKQTVKTINQDLIHANTEQRAELCRVLSWLEDGRYIINLGHFMGKIDEVIRMHLEYKNYCAQCI